MKIAILGGSFNPVHNGHLSLAENVYIELGFDAIVFFPAYISPFKQDAHIAPAHHRLAMLLEATKGNPHFLVDDFELNRQEVSYTIDTVRYCYSKYPLTGKPGLIVGADLLENIYEWKDAETLFELTDLIIGKRPSESVCTKARKNLAENNKLANAPHIKRLKFIELQNTALQISSTQIRNAISQKKAWRYLVQNSTYKYIEEEGLYKND